MAEDKSRGTCKFNEKKQAFIVEIRWPREPDQKRGKAEQKQFGIPKALRPLREDSTHPVFLQLYADAKAHLAMWQEEYKAKAREIGLANPQYSFVREQLPNETLGHIHELCCQDDSVWGDKTKRNAQAKNAFRLVQWLGSRRHPMELTFNELDDFFRVGIHKHLKPGRQDKAAANPKEAHLIRNRTVNHYVVSLFTLFNKAIDRGIVPKDHIDLTKLLRPEQDQKEKDNFALRVHQVHELMDCLRELNPGWRGELFADVAWFIVTTCSRPGEIIRSDDGKGLLLKDCHAVTGHRNALGKCTLFDTKCEKRRTIALDAKNWHLIRKWEEKAFHYQDGAFLGWVFPTSYEMFRRAVKECNVKVLGDRWGLTPQERIDFTPHCLRKTGITLHVNGWEDTERRWPAELLMKKTGHIRIQTLLDTYYKSRVEDQFEFLADSNALDQSHLVGRSAGSADQADLEIPCNNRVRSAVLHEGLSSM